MGKEGGSVSMMWGLQTSGLLDHGQFKDELVMLASCQGYKNWRGHGNKLAQIIPVELLVRSNLVPSCILTWNEPPVPRPACEEWQEKIGASWLYVKELEKHIGNNERSSNMINFTLKFFQICCHQVVFWYAVQVVEMVWRNVIQYEGVLKLDHVEQSQCNKLLIIQYCNRCHIVWSSI